MAEIRRDPLTGHSVVFSEAREARPRGVDVVRTEALDAGCPFCPGHEADTPPEVLADAAPGRAANASGWSLRLVPNRYPAFSADASAGRTAGSEGRMMEPPVEELAARGRHEILIFTPDHHRRLGRCSRAQVARALEIGSQRLAELRAVPGVTSTVWFQNDGPLAGATQSHPHWQLAALPVVLPALERERSRAREVWTSTGGCGYCSRIRSADPPEGLAIEGNEAYLALSPPAPRVPYETWILPRQHAAGVRGTFPHLDELGGLLRDVMRAIDLALDEPDYNLYLHALDDPLPRDADAFHWHIEILPRLVRVAGFEWASGMFVNGVRPESAVARLRGALEIISVEGDE